MTQLAKSSLHVENVAVFRSDLPLFSPISFSLSSGDALQITGANGSGKTSFLRCLCGLSQRHLGQEKRISSSIKWDGFEINAPNSTLYQNLLYLGHSLGLKPKLTVAQNLAFYQGLGFEVNPELIEDALTQLNIAEYIDEQVANLSAGQKRRVSLARLICEPVKVWVLDEPMVALDLAGQSWLETVCNSHVAKGGIIILTSHQKLKGISNLQILELENANLAEYLLEGCT